MMKGNLGTLVTLDTINKEFDLINIHNDKAKNLLVNVNNIDFGTAISKNVTIKIRAGIGQVNYEIDNIAITSSQCFTINAETLRISIRKISAGGADYRYIGGVCETTSNIDLLFSPNSGYTIDPGVTDIIPLPPFAKEFTIFTNDDISFRVQSIFGSFLVPGGSIMSYVPCAGAYQYLLKNIGAYPETFHPWYKLRI